jgi:hypothetical protein
MVLPFMKRGLSIAKPHLKSAAKNIVSEVVANAMTRSLGAYDVVSKTKKETSGYKAQACP